MKPSDVVHVVIVALITFAVFWVGFVLGRDGRDPRYGPVPWERSDLLERIEDLEWKQEYERLKSASLPPRTSLPR